MILVVRRAECAGCSHQPRPDEMVVAHRPRPDGKGWHRRPTRTWPELVAQVLHRPSMTRRLVLLLLVVTVPAAAVAAVLAMAGQLGVI